MDIITFNKIDLSYNNKKILDQLSFTIKKGDKITIQGKSGIGKSSIFHLILGFTKPQKGYIQFNNRIIDKTTVWDIRKKIAFIDQDTSLSEGKVINWIHSVFNFKANHSKNFPQKRMKELLEYFEIEKNTLNKNIEELSGGEKQRLAIIVSILLDRKIFLFDEITSALDIHLKEKVVNFFIKNKEWTVITISHDAVWIKHPEIKTFDLERKLWKQ